MVSRFTTGRPSFASSLAVSSAYYVVVWAVCDFGSAVDVAERVRDFDVNWQVAMIVVGAPAAIGVLAGLAVQKEWIYHVLRFVKLEPVHGIPSAWDWKFMRADQQWITVHLKDGTDVLAVKWREEGEAPERIVATQPGPVAMDHLDAEATTGQQRSFTRSLCAYPKLAQYDGEGDPDDAASFRCAAP